MEEVDYCAVCQTKHRRNNNNESFSSSSITSITRISSYIKLACGHVFCRQGCVGERCHLPTQFHLTKALNNSGGKGGGPTVTDDMRQYKCRVCFKHDPRVEGLKQFVYVKNLIDPSPDLLQLLYREWSLRQTIDTVKAQKKSYDQKLKEWTKSKEKASAKKLKEIDHKAPNLKADKKDRKKMAEYRKLVKAATASVEAEFEPKRRAIDHEHETSLKSINHGNDLDTIKTLLDEDTKLNTKTIQKHFRRASIKVHPDRNGPEYQAQFDLLTKAKNSLVDEALRERYLDDMMNVITTFGPAMLQSSHESWRKKHQPNEKDEKSSSRPNVQNQQRAAIEGGLLYSKPRKPTIIKIDENRRQVKIILRIPERSWDEFHYNVRTINLHVERSDQPYGEATVVTTSYKSGEWTIPKDSEGHEIRGEIYIDFFELSEYGQWNVWWSFVTLDVSNEEVTSEESELVEIKLESKQYRQHMADLLSFENMAKKRIRILRSKLKDFDDRGGTQQHDFSRFPVPDLETFQEVLLNAKHAKYYLKKAMKNVGISRRTAGTPLAGLRQVLDTAAPFEERVMDALYSKERREAKKNFKESVYKILESGDGESWIENMTKVDLADDGNRLYQLLIEGKKAYCIDLVDASTLSMAASRTDLFSAKQISSLAQRADAVEQKAIAEARRLSETIAEEEKKAKNREELEKYSSMFERGSIVQIHGLKSQANLNGRLCTYMGIHIGTNGDLRHSVRLDKGRDIALRACNIKYFQSGSMVRIPSQATNELEDASTSPDRKAQSPDATPGNKKDKTNRPSPSTSTSFSTQPLTDKSESSDSDTIPSSRNHHQSPPPQNRGGTRSSTANGNVVTPPHVDTRARTAPHVTSIPSTVSTQSFGNVTAPNRQPKAVPSLAPKITSAVTAAADDEKKLVTFLESQDKSLKCTPSEFFAWLKSEDITTLDDLVDACEDEDFVAEVIENGLKKFKLQAFRKSAAGLV